MARLAARQGPIRPCPMATLSSAAATGSPAAITVEPCAAGASW